MARSKNSTSGEDSTIKQAEPLATRLRDLLTDIGQVRQALGVSSQAINQWKLGESRPSLENLCKIADMYGVSTDYLLGRTEMKSPDTSIQAVSQTIGLSESAVLKLREFVEHPLSIMEPEGRGFECLGLEVLIRSSQFKRLLVNIAAFYNSVMNEFESVMDEFEFGSLSLDEFDERSDDVTTNILVNEYTASRTFGRILDEIGGRPING